MFAHGTELLILLRILSVQDYLVLINVNEYVGYLSKSDTLLSLSLSVSIHCYFEGATEHVLIYF